MLPKAEVACDPTIPALASFWTPDPELDIGDEGFGFFRGTWPIVDVSAEEASEQVDLDSRAVDLLAALVPTASDFERMAVEFEWADSPSFEPELLDIWDQSRHDDGSPLGGLEVGVAGLVWALSAFGCYPAASCRGHATQRPWSSYPVVYVAIDRDRAHSLQPIVSACGCGFGIDNARPSLLTIVAPSVVESTRLARELVSAAET